MKSNNRHFSLIIFLLIAITFTACQKKDIHYNAVINTTKVNSIKITSAKCGGIITPNVLKILSCGICWSTEKNPTTENSKTIESVESGNFTSTMTGLNPNTTYYVRAYAINSQVTGYGEATSFTTYRSDAVSDYDSNYYNIVTIGTQIWMSENLKTTHYSNGLPISEVTDSAQWNNITTGAYCNYSNNADIAATYGRLYNWYAVSDNMSIAPTGWHVATDAEWTTLTNYLGGDSVSGGKLKEVGNTHWVVSNIGANNVTGFTALPGGYRGAYGYFDFLWNGDYGFWWTSTSDSVSKAWNRDMSGYDIRVNRHSIKKSFGFSVRCIKD